MSVDNTSESGGGFDPGDGSDSTGPSVPLAAVYSVAVGVLLAVAVAVVCTSVLCDRRKRRPHHYYTAPTTNKTSSPSSRHAHAGPATVQNEQRMLDRTLSTMAPSDCEETLAESTAASLMTTEETTPTGYSLTQQIQTAGGDDAISSENSVLPDTSAADVDTHVGSNIGEGMVVVGEGRQNECLMGGRREMEGAEGSERTEQGREGEGVSYEDGQEMMVVTLENGQKLIPPEFAFEDGTVLQDYPSSTDLEVMDDTENTHRGRFMGQRDIYNSWILQSDSTQSQEHLKKCSSEQSIKSFPTVEVKGKSSLAVPSLVVPQTSVWDKRVRSSQSPDKGQVMPSATSSLEEAEKSLDKSVTELLELTSALSQEAKETGPQADSREKGCSSKEYQSLCDNKSHRHKAAPHAPPYHGSVPCLTVQVAQEDASVGATSSTSPYILTDTPKMRSLVNLLEQRVPSELSLEPDTRHTSLSTAESDDLLLISHV